MFGGKSCDGNSTDIDLCKDKECPGKIIVFYTKSMKSSYEKYTLKYPLIFTFF